jgi:uncharacterized membrane protein YidH (DUF202 family)
VFSGVFRHEVKTNIEDMKAEIILTVIILLSLAIAVADTWRYHKKKYTSAPKGAEVEGYELPNYAYRRQAKFEEEAKP